MKYINQKSNKNVFVFIYFIVIIFDVIYRIDKKIEIIINYSILLFILDIRKKMVLLYLNDDQKDKISLLNTFDESSKFKLD
jgi:hypothetical protein